MGTMPDRISPASMLVCRTCWAEPEHRAQCFCEHLSARSPVRQLSNLSFRRTIDGDQGWPKRVAHDDVYYRSSRGRRDDRRHPQPCCCICSVDECLQVVLNEQSGFDVIYTSDSATVPLEPFMWLQLRDDHLSQAENWIAQLSAKRSCEWKIRSPKHHQSLRHNRSESALHETRTSGCASPWFETTLSSFLICVASL